MSHMGTPSQLCESKFWRCTVLGGDCVNQGAQYAWRLLGDPELWQSVTDACANWPPSRTYFTVCMCVTMSLWVLVPFAFVERVGDPACSTVACHPGSPGSPRSCLRGRSFTLCVVFPLVRLQRARKGT